MAAGIRHGRTAYDDPGALLMKLRMEEPEEFAACAGAGVQGLVPDLGEFWSRYLIAARDRGEIHHDINIAEASEWVARVLLSLATVPGDTLDPSDPMRCGARPPLRHARLCGRDPCALNERSAQRNAHESLRLVGVHRSRRGLGDLHQELVVVLGLAQLAHQQVDGLMRVQPGQHPAQLVHDRELVGCDSSSSSLRVPDGLTSTAGNTRRSAILRSSLSSALPVPLNSSKITVSPVEPVSTIAVAMIVSEPPSSMLRAAPRKRFGGYSAVESTPPDRMRPDAGDALL